MRNSVNQKRSHARQIHPSVLISHEGFDPAKLFVSYLEHKLIDKAWRHQYWMFDVGRSMFDVQ